MRVQTVLFFAAILCDLAVAVKYDIYLYDAASCPQGGSGHVCSNIKKSKCCDNGGTTYKSAKFEAPGSTGCEDEMRAYGPGHGDNCYMSKSQSAEKECTSEAGITGAMVKVIGLTKRDAADGGFLSGRMMQPRAESQKADAYFVERGTERHVISLDSPEGKVLETLKTREEKNEHTVKFGKRQEVLEKRACPSRKGKGATAAKPGKKGKGS